MENFNKGDKVIWDSHFGYEIGVFEGEGSMENRYNVFLETGIVQGSIPLEKSEVHKWSPEKLEEVKKKYVYKNYSLFSPF